MHYVSAFALLKAPKAPDSSWAQPTPCLITPACPEPLSIRRIRAKEVEAAPSKAAPTKPLSL